MLKNNYQRSNFDSSVYFKSLTDGYFIDLLLY